MFVVWFGKLNSFFYCFAGLGHKTSFSNSGINKVAMVKNALLPMSLEQKKICQIALYNILLWVNEIIVCTID